MCMLKTTHDGRIEFSPFTVLGCFHSRKDDSMLSSTVLPLSVLVLGYDVNLQQPSQTQTRL